MTTSIRADLHSLAGNHRWSWHPPTRKLLDSLPGASPDRHPAATVAAIDQAELDAWASSEGHAEAAAALAAELGQVVASVSPPRIAYLSPEFGIASAVPQYSGGLGILAGDHLKAASDLAVPLVGVGLFYRQGFFRQALVDHAQDERYEEVDAESIGLVDTGASVTVGLRGVEVQVRVWRLMVGATPLLLLDSALAPNPPWARSITDRLYSGDRRHRLEQEMVLGVGGIRALRALGHEPEVLHLNEGHACFSLLELLSTELDRGADIDTAVEHVRAMSLFTTHTPVPAGIDRFDRRLVVPELQPWATRLGTDVGRLLDWATMPADGPARPFNTAAFCLRLCGRVNGVSQLHASVSRQLFASVAGSDGIEGVTNGVHARTWVSPGLQACFDEHLGASWACGDADAWQRVDRLDDATLADLRRDGRAALADLVAERTGRPLDPDVCTIGFARRFATYKRASLMLQDADELDRLLADDDSPVQLVFAGKAHPADTAGKAVLAELAAFADSPAARGRVVLVPDYDIALAKALYAGCDVWLNNPLRPREACGTSGEKATLNGALNCSVLDGWWADWYTEGIGWVVPSSDALDGRARDLAEAEALHAALADAVATFHDGGRPGSRWWEMVRSAWRHLGPLVVASRMVREYDARFYHQLGRR